MTQLLQTDHDSRWKEIITDRFEEFVSFFLPDLYPLIDFSVQPEFLEQEFQDIIIQKFKGKKIVDKLAKVQLKNGEDKWILIHVEVQSSFETNFAERVFIYYYLIYDRYGKQNVEVLAIYTSKKTPKYYNQYHHAFGDTSLTFKFKAYRVNRQNEVALKASNNIFALAVLACLYLQKSGRDMNQRFAYKSALIELAHQKYPNDKMSLFYADILALLRFIHYIVLLEPDLALKFEREIYSKFKEKDMLHPSPQDYRLANVYYEAITGESITALLTKKEAETTERVEAKKIEEIKLMQKALMEAEQAKLQAAEETKQAKLKAAEETKQAKLKAAEETKQAKLKAAEEVKLAKQEILKQAATVLLKNHTKEEVATLLNVQLEEIEQIFQ